MNARHRSEAIRKLESYAPVIFEHMLKIHLYPHQEAKRHWIAELDAYAGRLKKFVPGKGGKPNFNVELLMEYLYADQVTDVSLDFAETYGPTEERLDLEKLHAMIEDYAQKILA